MKMENSETRTVERVAACTNCGLTATERMSFTKATPGEDMPTASPGTRVVWDVLAIWGLAFVTGFVGGLLQMSDATAEGLVHFWALVFVLLRLHRILSRVG